MSLVQNTFFDGFRPTELLSVTAKVAVCLSNGM